jgi:hypothetical protein
MNHPQPQPSTDPGEAPDPSVVNRYGPPKRSVSRRTRNAVVGAALVLAVGAAAAMSLGNANRFTSKDVAFDITSPTTARVTFDLDRRAADPIECSVRVLNESYAIVGWKSVLVPPGEGSGRENVRTSVELRTESLGVSGGVGDCWRAD